MKKLFFIAFIVISLGITYLSVTVISTVAVEVIDIFQPGFSEYSDAPRKNSKGEAIEYTPIPYIDLHWTTTENGVLWPKFHEVIVTATGAVTRADW